MTWLFAVFYVLSSWSAGNGAPSPSSECTELFLNNGSVKKIDCPYKIKTFDTGLIEDRDVLYHLPKTSAPKQGFPVVMIFQGSYFPVEFSRTADVPLGGFHEVRLIQTLLDSGFAVLVPRARLHLAWETNLEPATDYRHTSDYRFMLMILESISKGDFGNLDSQSLYATGISSGGYQSSRMALEFAENFKAIAIHSGSYATFMGPVTPKIPSIAKNHPPTLFVHGTDDPVVPIATVKPYSFALDQSGIENKTIAVPDGRHTWFELSPEAIRNWFLIHK